MTDTVDVNTDDLLVGGEAFGQLLDHVDIDEEIKTLREEIPLIKSVTKRDTLVKKLKYLAGLKKTGLDPKTAYVINAMPVLPPTMRPLMIKSGNRLEFADVHQLYKDHMTLNNSFKKIKDVLSHQELIEQRKGLYDGAAAIFGFGEAISGASRGRKLKGLSRQIAGEGGPKKGLFQDKILKKKQDFSARGTIYAEPNIGFNEIAMPRDMLWPLYKFHGIRDLVKSGYHYVDADKAWETKSPAAQSSFAKLIKHIPVFVNRAPSLMRSNITAHFPVPIDGKTIGVNPLHLPLYAGDYDGDAVSVFLPMSPEAIAEAKEKVLPQHQLYDFRKGYGNTLVAPGHEAIIGSVHLTEPDTNQKVMSFKTEADALAALEKGEIKENTPIKILDAK